MMETGEIIYEKVYASPRPPPKISFKDNWMKELDSEVVGGSGGTTGLLTKEIGKRKHKLKNGETCECNVIQPELCSVC